MRKNAEKMRKKAENLRPDRAFSNGYGEPPEKATANESSSRGEADAAIQRRQARDDPWIATPLRGSR